MADQRRGTSGIVKALEDHPKVLIFYEVNHGSVPARDENADVVLRMTDDGGEFNGMTESGLLINEPKGLHALQHRPRQRTWEHWNSRPSRGYRIGVCVDGSVAGLDQSCQRNIKLVEIVPSGVDLAFLQVQKMATRHDHQYLPA